MILIALPVLLLAGCGDDSRTSALEKQLQASDQRLSKIERDNELLHNDVAALRRDLSDANTERDRLHAQMEGLPAGDSVALAELEKRIMALEARKDAGVVPAAEQPKPEAADAADAPPPAAEPRPETVQLLRRIDELLPIIKAGTGSGRELEELIEPAWEAEKSYRDTLIEKMREWVKAEPENGKARLGLAAALTTRFRDVSSDMMKQAELGAEVKKEVDKALEINPEAYDAWHFLATYNVWYPTFTTEFQEANKVLDKCLALQSQMAWEERFCEIYASYGMWYRKQNKLDDALAKVNEGLEKSAQDKGLLAEKVAIEKARTAEGG
jgi:tetratricopeptide (TPR) repeat protein